MKLGGSIKYESGNKWLDFERSRSKVKLTKLPDFDETWCKHWVCQWQQVTKFWEVKVKGQAHKTGSKVKLTNLPDFDETLWKHWVWQWQQVIRFWKVKVKGQAHKTRSKVNLPPKSRNLKNPSKSDHYLPSNHQLPPSNGLILNHLDGGLRSPSAASSYLRQGREVMFSGPCVCVSVCLCVCVSVCLCVCVSMCLTVINEKKLQIVSLRTFYAFEGNLSIYINFNSKS